MTTTRTYYTIQIHAYTERTACTAPATCTDSTHWSLDDQEHGSAAVARQGLDWYDAPATRIAKVTEVRTVEVL